WLAPGRAIERMAMAGAYSGAGRRVLIPVIVRRHWATRRETGSLARRGGARPAMAIKQHARFNFWYSLGAILLLMLFQSLWASYRTIEALPYSALLEQLDAGNVEEVWVSENQVRGRLVEPLPTGRREFVTV